MRVAANAGRAAAMAIYLHPALRTAAAVATWLGVAKFTYDVADGLWKRVDPNAQASDGQEYSADLKTWHGSRESACQHRVASFEPYAGYVSFSGGMEDGLCTVYGYRADNSRSKVLSTGVQSRPSNCPVGWYVTSAGCVQTPPMQPVPQSDFVQGLPDARPMPPELPGIVWPAAWPIEIPEIQPTFIPTGAPVPNPNYDPSKAPGPNNQPYSQPGINVQPAPTPSSPWQVNLQPVDRPVSNPNPGSDPVPNVNPDGSAKPDPGDKPKERDDRDFCDKHPDVIACQKLEEPEDPGKLPEKAVDLNFEVQSGYGGAAVCPAPIVVNTWHSTLSFSWQPFCNQLELAKNLILASAWLIAAFILLRPSK